MSDEKERRMKGAYCREGFAAGDAESGRGGGASGVLGAEQRGRWVREWNRAFLLVCAAGLAFDPLFFYTLSISGTGMCLFIDGWLALSVTALRCMADALHVWNMWLHLKITLSGEASEDDNGKAARRAVMRYFKSPKGFFFDLFVILPIPQVTNGCFPSLVSHFLASPSITNASLERERERRELCTM